MSNITSDKLKPLTFSSYEELKTRGTAIDKSVIYNLKRNGIAKCLKHFVEIEREARMRWQEGDEEQAYILYSRAMELCRLISDKKDDAFTRSNDGRFFYDTAERMFADFGKLTERLKLRFADQKAEGSAKPRTVKNEFIGLLERDDLDLFNGMYAKPQQIVRFLELERRALVLDYRTDQNKSPEYKGKKGSMKVVHIEKELIMLGSLLQSIVKALDISVRPVLETISQFDIVILLGDLDDISKEKVSKTKILYEALTTYNINNKLKRPPVVIERGFASWENTYPYYITDQHDVPKCEKTFDEQFSTWLAQSKEANKLRIDYPDLTGYNELSTKQEAIPKNIQSTVARRSESSSAGYRQRESSVSSTSILYPSEALKQHEKPVPASSFFDSKSKTSSSFQTYDKTTISQEQINKTKIPSFDRSKKPTDNDITHHQSNSLWHNKENRAPSNVSMRSALPQVLGGARVADVQIEQPHPTGASTHAPPQRPPTPDRTAKNNVLAKQQQETSSYFNSSYLMTRERIIEDSKRGKTKLGYTGLINMGNTCFMNATLQALFHTPEFSNLFRNQNVANLINCNNKLGTRGVVSGAFAALLDLVWSGEFIAIRPHVFLNIFAQRVNSALADRQQHDAQEFQIYLLDALHEDTNKVDKRRPFEQNYDNSNLNQSAKDFSVRSRQFSSSPVNDIFNLTTVSTLQCQTCKATSVRFEGLNQISVELSSYGNPLKLKECLNTHFSTTALDALWDCPHCKSKQSASRSTKIWTVPKVLIIHMKRFSFNAGHFVKNEAEVSFDINGFDLSQYLHTKAPTCKALYNLYAITNHSGNLNSGHYTSYVRNLASSEREWLHFDDERCTRSNTPSSLSRQAFLLYYTINTNESGSALM